MLSSYITVVGNVASEPRLEVGEDGASRCYFRVACSERRQDRATQQWVDHATTFFSITVWRDMADNVVKTLRKGDRVVLAGRFRQREWKAKDGSVGTSLEVDVDVIGPDLRWRAASVDRTQRVKAAAEPEAESAREAESAAEPPAADARWDAPAPDFDHQTGQILEPASELEPVDSSAA